jgi:hypothetical protein
MWNCGVQGTPAGKSEPARYLYALTSSSTRRIKLGSDKTKLLGGRPCFFFLAFVELKGSRRNKIKE